MRRIYIVLFLMLFLLQAPVASACMITDTSGYGGGQGDSRDDRGGAQSFNPTDINAGHGDSAKNWDGFVRDMWSDKGVSGFNPGNDERNERYGRLGQNGPYGSGPGYGQGRDAYYPGQGDCSSGGVSICQSTTVPAPEPSTFLLLGMGGVAAAFVVRRNRRIG